MIDVLYNVPRNAPSPDQMVIKDMEHIYSLFTQTYCTRHLYYGKQNSVTIWFKIRLDVKRNT